MRLEKALIRLPIYIECCQTVWIQIRPDLGPNCLQRLSAKNTSKRIVKVSAVLGKVN